MLVNLSSLKRTKKIFFEAQLIYSAVLFSGEWQSDSVIHVHVSILFQILFPYKLIQNIEYNFLCYTVGSQLYILYKVVYIC